jgi:fimbrial chaperone protein
LNHFFVAKESRLAIARGQWRKVLIMLAALMAVSAGSARAITFTVFPISVVLSATVRSQTLTIHNHSEAPIRFQLSAFAWDQKPDGEMVLNPTDDVIFFPQLLSIDPNQERNIRGGTTAPPGEVEKNYRIFVEELPAAETAAQAQTPQVKVLTKMGLPIFIQPSKLNTDGRIEDLRMARGIFHFTLKNVGNVHFTAETVKVSGFNGGTSPVFGRQASGWYVLAGGTREFDLPIPKADCAKIRTMEAEVKTEQATAYTGKLEVPAEACVGAGAGELAQPKPARTVSKSP